MPEVRLTLYTTSDAALASLSLDQIHLSVKQRLRLNGVGLQAHVGSIVLADMSTNWSQLGDVLKGQSPLPGGQWLSLALETADQTTRNLASSP